MAKNLLKLKMDQALVLFGFGYKSLCWTMELVS